MRLVPCLSLCLFFTSIGVAVPVQAHSDSAAPAPEAAPAESASLTKALAGSWRTPSNVARDPWRHPAQTLAFFGLRDDMTVIEITPGGGWYSEVLAPWLGSRGHYVAAVVDPAAASSDAGKAATARGNEALAARLAALPAAAGHASLQTFMPNAPEFAPAGTADAVLTFRNVHNWMMAGSVQTMFNGFFAALKPGGVLGVVEHRANSDVPEGDRSGYVSEAQVIAFASAAGFVLEAKSEINANPKDSKDHPNGVWTLPPVNSHEPSDDAKYQAIGESDRMTLRFRKPQ